MSGIQIDHLEGRRCSTAVEHTPGGREVVGSNPAGSWGFPSLLYLISGASLIRPFTSYFLIKICLAMQLEAKQA